MRGLQNCLDTLKEVIVSQQTGAIKHEPTPAEYFAIIVATLSAKVDESKLPLLLKIFVGVIPSTSTALLRSQFRPIMQVLINVVKLVTASSSNETILSLALTAIGKILVQQETSQGFWDGVQALQAFNALLTFIDDQHHKVRKAAVQSLIDILGHHAKQKFGGMRAYFHDFAHGVVKSCSRSNYRRALCLVIMLESAFAYIPENSAKKLMESCVKLQSCEISKLTSAVYRMIDATFQHPSYAFSPAVTTALYTQLLASKPNTADVETQCYFYSALGSGFLKVLGQNPDGAKKVLPKVNDYMVVGCEAEFTQIHISICTSWKRIVQQLLTPAALAGLAVPSNWATQSINKLSKGQCADDMLPVWEIASALDRILSFRFQLSWVYTLDVVRAFLQACKGQKEIFFLVSGLATKVADTVQGIVQGTLSIDASLHDALITTVASVLHSCGLATFLKILPVMDSAVTRGDLLNQVRGKDWMIELMQQEVKQLVCSLGDFVLGLLPIAAKFHKMVNEDETMNEVLKKVLRNRVIQLWSLLPEICTNRPSDLVASFPKMQNLLTQAVQEENYPEIAFAAARTCGLLAGHFHELHVKTHEQSAHYLPLLLQYSETLTYGDGKLQEALHAVANWMKLSPEALSRQTCRHLLKLVLTHTHGAHSDPETLEKAAVWMATLLAIIPALSPQLVDLVFQTLRPMLAVDEALALQKTSYSLLHALIQHHLPVLQQHAQPLDLLRLVSQSLVTAHVSTRSTRLKCIRALLDHLTAPADLEAAMDAVLTEVLVCQKDANKKCRDGAVTVLQVFVARVPAPKIFKKICLSLSSESTLLTASALNALSLLLMEQQQKNPRPLAPRRAKAVKKPKVEDVIEAVNVGKKRGRRDEEDEDEEDEEEEQEQEGDEEQEDEGEDKEAVDMDDGAAEQQSGEFDELQRLGTDLLPSISLLLSQQSTEQTKACLSFLKVLAGAMHDRHLLRAAQPIAQAAFVDVGELKEKFATRLRAIVRKLLKRLDMDSVRTILPAQDQPLVDYIARQQRKDWRSKHKKASEAEKEKWSKFEKVLGSDSEDESEDEAESGDSPAAEDYRLDGRRLKAIRAQGAGFARLLPSVLDTLLQGQDAGSATAGQTLDLRSGGRKAHRPTPAQASLTKGKDALAAVDGKEPVEDDEEEAFQVTVSNDGKVVVKQREEAKKRSDAKADTKADDPKAAVGPAATQHQRPVKKRKTLSLKEPGAEYRAKNAGGDVWRKGVAVQPHAYIPLDARLLSKKHRAQAVQHFAVVVDSNKRNRQQGKKKKA